MRRQTHVAIRHTRLKLRQDTRGSHQIRTQYTTQISHGIIPPFYPSCKLRPQPSPTRLREYGQMVCNNRGNAIGKGVHTGLIRSANETIRVAPIHS